MESFNFFMTILIPLLIIMDPLGNLPFFLLFTARNTPQERKRMAATASGAAGAVLVFFGLTGDSLLRYFGITLPAFQLAGGLVFLIYSLQMLALIPSGIKTSQEEEEEGASKHNAALVPLAIPLLAGPGAITAVLVWRQSHTAAFDTLLLVLAVLLACGIVYVFFLYAERVRKAMGLSGIRVVTRLMGLLLAVIAVQFMVNGFQQLR